MGWVDAEKGRLALQTMGPCWEEGLWAVLSCDSGWALRLHVGPQTAWLGAVGQKQEGQMGAGARGVLL